MDKAGGDRGQIAVFLLDDHEIVRRGVRDVLEADPGITVIGEAGTAESALARLPALKPDVAVVAGRPSAGQRGTACPGGRAAVCPGGGLGGPPPWSRQAPLAPLIARGA